MTVPNSTYRIFAEKLGGSDPSQFVGNEGEVFYDPNTSQLKLSDGSTPGGVSIGGSTSTGNITFSGERIIGNATDEFDLGLLQLVPSETESGYEFIDNGQYINIYPTAADDAPHIHITAGTLSTTSPYYNEVSEYFKGDIFIGDDNNYFSVEGDGLIQINSNKFLGTIAFDGNGIYDRSRINLYQDGTELNLYYQGLDFDSDYGFAKPERSYVGTGSSSLIYTSRLYENEIGSLKLLIQCQGSNGSCQLSDLLVIKPYGIDAVYQNEIGRVTGIGTTAHINFVSSFNSSTNEIEVFADTTSDPEGDQWSFVVCPIEVKDYQD